LSKTPSRSAAVLALGAVLLVAAAGRVAWVLTRDAPRSVASVVPPVPSPVLPTPTEAPPEASVEARSEVRGRVLDADGNPAANATVRAIAASSWTRVLLETASDAAGRFALDGLGAAVVRVAADRDPDGFALSAELHVAETRSLELTLVLSAAGSVLGTVVDGQDHAVAGAAISIDGLPWVTRKAASDAAGAFRLPAVPKEAPTLVAVASGYKTARVPLPARQEQTDVTVRVQLESAPPVQGLALDPDGKPVKARVVACDKQAPEARVDTGDDGTFSLPPATLGCLAVAQHDDYAPSDSAVVAEGQQLVLQLKAGGALEGEVVDDRGAPVTSFSVGVESFSGAQRRGGNNGGARKIEDPRGAFRWDKLAPGDYVLTASAQDKPPTHSDPVNVTAGATSRCRIVLAAGGTVVGHVFDERHAPVADVNLSFDTVSSVVGSSANAKSDTTGKYRLGSAPTGNPFTLKAQKDGYRVRFVSGLHVDPRATITQDVVLTAMDGGPGLELGGIGANVAGSPEGIVFAAIYPGDPADKAGLHAGDRVLRVDGEDTEHMSVADAIQRMRGEIGTTVGVSVGRGRGETLDVFITRAAIVH
jgi:hypothetical protein